MGRKNVEEKERRETRAMKSIPSKLRKSDKKEYIGPGTVVFSPLDLPPLYLLFLGLAYPGYEDRVLRRCSSPSRAVYQGKSCQESLLQKRKVNVVVLVPVFVVFPPRPRFFITSLQRLDCIKHFSFSDSTRPRPY